MSTADDPLIGQVLAGQFRIESLLGTGGMGAVYLAEQAEMGRQVVVKVVHPELTVGSPQIIERFKREARAVAALNHPHIVQVYVFGQAEDGRLFLAMELVDGRDLAQELAQGPLDPARAVRILDQVASALTEAHAHGIVHRDLKPENIMLTSRHGNDDWVKVLDFGIAKVGAAESGPALTQAGAIFGTPRYMSPEQIQGDPVDARSDLYALGIILYELLTGAHPFRAKSTLDYLVKHVNEAAPHITRERPDLVLPPRLDGVLSRLLEKDPAARFQTAAELQRELRAALSEIGDPMKHTLSLSSAAVAAAVRESEHAATVTSAPEGPPRPKKARVWPWVAAGLVLVGGGIGAALALSGPSSTGVQAVTALAPTGATTQLAIASSAGGTAPAEGALQAAHDDPAEAEAPDETPDEEQSAEADTPAQLEHEDDPNAEEQLEHEDDPNAEEQREHEDDPNAEEQREPHDDPSAGEQDEGEPLADDTEDTAQLDPDGSELADDLPARALQDIEGLPVPVDTTVAAKGPLALTLHVDHPAEHLAPFYAAVLGDRAQETDDGFVITDRRIPYTRLRFASDERGARIEATRRPVSIARPRLVEPEPEPPRPDQEHPGRRSRYPDQATPSSNQEPRQRPRTRPGRTPQAEPEPEPPRRRRDRVPRDEYEQSPRGRERPPQAPYEQAPPRRERNRPR